MKVMSNLMKSLPRALRIVACAFLGLLLGFALTMTTLKDHKVKAEESCCTTPGEVFADGSWCSSDPCSEQEAFIVRPANNPYNKATSLNRQWDRACQGQGFTAAYQVEPG